MNEEQPIPTRKADPAPPAETLGHLTYEHLAAIVGQLSEGVTLHSAEGQLIYANEVAAKWLGQGNSVPLDRVQIPAVLSQFEIFDEQGNVFPWEKLPGRRARNGEGAAEEIIQLRIRSTGEEVWALVKASAVYDPQGQVKFVVNIYQDITAFKQGERDLRFLAEVSDMLATSMDYPTVMTAIANLAVKHLADWCTIHLQAKDGSIQQLGVAHKNPSLTETVKNLQERFPPNPELEYGIYRVMRTGEELFLPEITDEVLRSFTRSDEHFNTLQKIGLRSSITLPIAAQGRILGAVSLVWIDATRSYGEREIILARELAWRAALAVDHVRLFQEIKDLNEELESLVKRRTAQLERMIDRLQSEAAERQKAEKELIRSQSLFADLFELSPDAILLVDQEGIIVQSNAQGFTMFGYPAEELTGQHIRMLLPERFRDIHAHHRRHYGEAPTRRAMGVEMDLFGLRKNGQEFPVDVMLSPIKIEDQWLVISVVRDITLQKAAQIELAEVQHQLMDTFEKERLMLAHELHDGMIQELFSITFELAEIKKDLASSNDEKTLEKLRVASEMTRHVIQGLRGLTRDLRPPALAPFGLEQAILSHMEYFQELHPELKVHLELDPDGQTLEEKVRLVLFRIYQNAVSNVVRHARAENIWIHLDLNDRQVSLEIKDDGIGFELPGRWVELARRGHLGLVGIRERVEAIGGTLKVNSQEGQGTVIRVVVPLPAARKK